MVRRPAWVLAMIAGVGMAFSNGAPTGIWADVGAGVLLGAPIAILAGLLVWRESRLVTFLGVEAGLAALIDLVRHKCEAAIGSGGSGRIDRLARRLLPGQHPAGDRPRRVGHGEPARRTPSPLAAVADPIFIGLGVIAALAVVIALLERPPHAGAGPDPWDPHFSRSSGIVPLVVAMFAGLAFEWTAAVEAPLRPVRGGGRGGGRPLPHRDPRRLHGAQEGPTGRAPISASSRCGGRTDGWVGPRSRLIGPGPGRPIARGRPRRVPRWARPDLNRRSSLCESDVLTAGLRARRDGRGPGAV